MKVSASFSGKEIENVSLDFSKLREKGLEYIQELSGDIWTDYNSHDPGVTMLEQLVYALTDVAYRTSLPIEDLLTTEKDVLFPIRENAFFAPSAILTSHPVTVQDTRKMIIDKFENIQNVWISSIQNIASGEQVNGINQIEILPKLKFLKSSEKSKNDFLNDVKLFLQQNRTIGEWYNAPIVLEPQFLSINFHIYLTDQVDFYATLAKVFVKLLEFIYSPIQYSSLSEMQNSGFSLQEIFSGPQLKRGFLKNFSEKPRRKIIYSDEIQKVLSKVEGIVRCEVKPFIINGGEKNFIEAEPGKFFHLLMEDNSNNFADNRFDGIYKNMTVFVNKKELKDFNRQKINNLFTESWSKKHRGYSLGDSPDNIFFKEFAGTWQNPKVYHSLQRHFPLIYAIGEEGLSKYEPEERKAQAHQLKAFLLLFEQHFANHLAQLGSLNEFFNIGFNEQPKKTYFTQWMDSVPGIEELAVKNVPALESYLESEDIFFDRKNRIYDHLLARFGEDFNEIPWKVSRHMRIIRNDKEYNLAVLKHKSNYLQQLDTLSYSRTKGEHLIPEKKDDKIVNFKRIPSGLENIILGKTGITRGDNPVFIHSYTIPFKGFENLDEKTLFRETLNDENYRIQKLDSEPETAQVEFQYEKDKWIKILENDGQPVQDISKLVDFFIQLNQQSEGIYIVDHILLQDFLTGSQFGFSYFNVSGCSLFYTKEVESWLDSAKKRDEIFAPVKLKKENFSIENGTWMIRHEKWEPVSFSVENDEFNRLKSDIENDIYFYLDGKLDKKGDDASTKKSSREFTLEKQRIEKLEKIFDDVYSKTKNLNSPVKMALFRNFYFYETNYWTLKYGKNTLASFKIPDEDVQQINEIQKQQAFFFKDGKWSIQFDEKMLGVYEINKEDLQTLITVLGEQNYFFEEGNWKLKEKISTGELQHLEEKERLHCLEKHNKKRSLFDNVYVQKFVSDYEINLKILTRLFENVYQENKSIVQLLNTPEESGRMRFNELEEIRFRGTKDSETINYTQRRLVFQRKLSDDLDIQDEAKIINEDFFNLKVSVIIPDWPARFQEVQFKDYVEGLIHERIPSHIANKIYAVDRKKMESFEKNYSNWQELKAESLKAELSKEESTNPEKPSRELMKAAFKVYSEIQELKNNKE